MCVTTIYCSDSPFGIGEEIKRERVGQNIINIQRIFHFLASSLTDECLTIIIFIIFSRVRLSPLGTAATTGLLYQPQILDDGDCGAIGGMKIGRGNRSTWRKPAPAPLCPPQIPHDQTPGSNTSRPGGKPTTNCLSYDVLELHETKPLQVL
jgi:hypothetical protein